MAEYLIQDSTLTGIADAIREKTGNADPIYVSGMAEMIAGITGGGAGGSGLSGIFYEAMFGATPYVYRRQHFVFGGELYLAIMNKSTTAGVVWPIYKYSDGAYTQVSGANTGYMTIVNRGRIFECAGKLHALGNDSNKHYIADGVSALVEQSATCPIKIYNGDFGKIAVHNDEIYVTDTTAIYKWSTGSGWSTLCTHNLNGKLALVVHRGELYLLRGVNNGNTTVYLVENDTLTEIAVVDGYIGDTDGFYYNGSYYWGAGKYMGKFNLDTYELNRQYASTIFDELSETRPATIYNGKLIIDGGTNTGGTGFSCIMHDFG